ncbi:SdrD B-like domain-containing protein, partial [Methanosaeta sp. UBA356]
ETVALNETAATDAVAEAVRGYTIEGVVFEDLDGNGVMNVNESGLANWTVNLEQPEGVIITSVNTSADGKFIFLNQLPGVYTIKEVLQAGWTLISPADGKFTAEVINESVTHLEFANNQS